MLAWERQRRPHIHLCVKTQPFPHYTLTPQTHIHDLQHIHNFEQLHLGSECRTCHNQVPLPHVFCHAVPISYCDDSFKIEYVNISGPSGEGCGAGKRLGSAPSALARRRQCPRNDVTCHKSTMFGPRDNNASPLASAASCIYINKPINYGFLPN